MKRMNFPGRKNARREVALKARENDLRPINRRIKELESLKKRSQKDPIILQHTIDALKYLQRKKERLAEEISKIKANMSKSGMFVI